MQVVYTKINPRSSPLSDTYRPLLSVIFINRTKSFTTKALIDSGADQTILNSALAKYIGIDNYKSGIKTRTESIDGIEHDVYLHDIEVEVVDLPNSRVKINVGFIKLDTIGILLGQKGFFEHYKISFEKYQLTFCIETTP